MGGCGEYTTCKNGALVCAGAFVAPVGIGAPGNPGTQAQPVSTIAEAQAIATALGNGVDICICGTGSPTTPTFYREQVTMIEGMSLYGGYNCADWSRDLNVYTTYLQSPWTIGGSEKATVVFNNGITSDTALDGVVVYGPNAPPSQWPLTSIGIAATNASFVLQDVGASGGSADYSGGLRAMVNNGSIQHLTAIRGGYGDGAAIYNMTATFTDVTISRGISFNNAGASTFTGGSIGAGYNGAANGATLGLSIRGNANGLSISNTTIDGGTATFGSSTSTTGVSFYNCIGSPSMTNVSVHGGNSSGTSTGLIARGAQCSPTFIGGTILGCPGGSGQSCIGVACSDGAACNVRDSQITGMNAALSLPKPTAISCRNGGCGTFSGNTIAAGLIDTALIVSTANAFGIDVDNANPEFRDNDISSVGCPNNAKPIDGIYAARFSNSTSVLTNNVFHDQPCPNAVVDMVRLGAGAAITMHNNTVQFSTCTGCGVRRGLFLAASASGALVRNNIFVNAGSSDFANAFGVYETDATNSLLAFEHNALWMPGGGTSYLDNGSTSLLLAAINALPGAGGNIAADPLLDATYHLLPGSPCRNAGTTVSNPVVDFDGDARPQEMSFDIGADEYVP